MFKTGDKVVCIDDSSISKEYPSNLIKNKTYTVKECFIAMRIKDNKRGYCVVLEETSPTGAYSYSAERFRKVEDNFAEQVLEAIKQGIKEEQLVEV